MSELEPAQRSNLPALAVTILWPVLAAGGFSAKSQIVFGVLAAALLAVTLTTAGAEAAIAFRYPPVVTLLLVGALSAASAAWTIGSAGSALRTGLVCGAYAVVAAVALLAARGGAGVSIAVGIAVIAAAEALVGLVATATHSLPEAERLAGVWRPGGTFEYQPALALLQVGAIPIYSSYIGGRRGWPVAVAAAGSVLAGATVALAADRLAIVLALILTLVLVALARTDRERLKGALILAASGGLGAIVAVAVLDHTVGVGASPPGLVALAPIVGAAALAAVCATGFRARSWRGDGASSGRSATAVVLALVALMVVAALVIGRPAATSAAHNAGFFHGRLEEWRAALQTWWQQPLLGSGAGTYFQASLHHQTLAVSRFAHNLPLEWAAELGILGSLVGLGLYATVSRSVVRSRHAPDALRLAPFVVAFLVSNLLDWTWHLAGITALWAAALGALAGSALRRVESPVDS